MLRFLERHPRFTALTFVALMLGLFVIPCYFLVGFSINLYPQSPIERLNEARSKWNSNNIHSYRMTVYVSMEPITSGQFTVTVRDGEVVESSLSPFDTQLNWMGYYSLLQLPKEASQYTVERLFDLATPVLEPIPAPPVLSIGYSGSLYDISFDPDYGFISCYSFGGHCSAGIICSDTTDCPANFVVLKFEPLPGE